MSEQDPAQLQRMHQARLDAAIAIFAMIAQGARDGAASEHSIDHIERLATAWKTMSEGRIETATATLESFAEPLDSRAMVSDADVMFQAFERRLLTLSGDGEIHVREDFARFMEKPWRVAVVDKAEPNDTKSVKEASIPVAITASGLAERVGLKSTT